MKYEKICFKINQICNMDCSFCIQKDSPKKDSVDQGEILKGLIEDGTKKFAFIGGEPLLTYNYLRYMIDLIPDDEKYSIKVITNGSMLNMSKVRYFNTRNVGLDISFNSIDAGEKTLMQAIKLSKLTPEEYMGCFKLLENKSLRKVISPSVDFAKDLIGLYMTFPDVLGQLSFDLTETNFDLKDIHHLEEQLYFLRDFNSDILNKWQPIMWSKYSCDCKDNVAIDVDGTYGSLCKTYNVVTKSDMGCGLIEQNIGKDNFDIMHTVMKSYWPENYK